MRKCVGPSTGPIARLRGRSKPAPTSTDHTMSTKYTAKDAALARKLEAVANEEGTIQPDAMQRIAPHNRPELHKTMSVAEAFRALTGETYDPDRV